MASRQQRTELTVKQKLDIIDSYNSRKFSRKELEQRYRVTKPTISRILSLENELKNTKNGKLKRIRSGSNRLVDEAVSKWYRSMKEQNIFVNGPLLRRQAVKIARMMNNNTFKANNGWLWRWQQKENVKFNASGLGRTTSSTPKPSKPKAVNKSQTQSGLETNELGENTSNKSFDESDRNVSWQSMSKDLEESSFVIAHSDITIKEEVDEFQRIPLEAEVVFDVESSEQGGCDDETSQNTYHPQCSNVNNDGEKTNQDDASIDHESFQASDVHHQPIELKKEPNYDYQVIDSEEEYETIRLARAKKVTDPQDIYSIYGDYIARRLRASAKERESYEIYIAQHNIDEVIFKLSMGSYAREIPVRPFENSKNGQDDTIRQKQPQNRSSYQEKRFFQDVRLRSTSSLINTSIPVINFNSTNQET